jgi:glucose/mannose-6-phosphate isomerase
MKIEDLEEIDKQLMYKAYDAWPEIAKESFEKKFEKIDIKDIDHIVFSGMGGSGTIGDTIEAILSKQNMHVTVVKGYVLPKTVDSKTLVITTSVSGKTSETLEILKQAKDMSAKTIGFSSGGLLESFCKENDLLFQKIDMIHSPRASFPQFLFSILNVLEPILPIKQNEIDESIFSLEKTRQNVFSGNLNSSNIALDLAEFSKDLVCIYHPDGLKASAIRYKNSLQENSKTHAMIEDVIESCHNGIVAWETDSNVKPVLIQGSDDNHNTIERWEILEEFFNMRGIDFKIIKSVEGNILSKIMNLIYTLDYSTLYLSILKKIDPSPVRSIDFIKKKLY